MPSIRSVNSTRTVNLKGNYKVKKFLALYAVAALMVCAGSALAGYDISTERLPDGSNSSAPYTVTLEDTATDVLSTDYIQIFDTVNKDSYIIDATKVYGLGAAKAGAFTTIDGTVLTLTGDIVGDGGDQLYGFKQDQVASTSASLTIAQCGKTIVSNSADVIVLPEASTALGCRYTFVCGTADDFDIDPADGTDAIGSVSTTNGTTGVVTLAPSAGDEIRCTDIGGSITLEAIAADLWAQVGGGNGIWTDVN